MIKCKCINNIEEKALSSDVLKFKKKIIAAELQGIFVLTPNVKKFSSTTLTVTLEGQKKKEEIEMKHTFCPFCGKKTEPEEKEEKND